jgi:V-type H+-transporting ATPase subunit a
MGILRSETMSHGLLVLPVERARNILNSLGHTAPIEFKDMLSADTIGKSRPYKKYVARLENTLKMIRVIISEIEKTNPDALTTGRLESFLDRNRYEEEFKYDALELKITKQAEQFEKFARNSIGIKMEILSAREEKALMNLAVRMLDNLPKGATAPSEATASLLANEGGVKTDTEMMFSNVAGTCLASDAQRISRQVFRATRGNTFTISEDIEEPVDDPRLEKPVRKSVFTIYFQGSVSSAMSDKVMKICQASGCTMYPWAATKTEAKKRLEALTASIKDKEKAEELYAKSMGIETTKWVKPLEEGGNSEIEDVRLFVEKERAIYVALNKFEGAYSTLRAECWYPTKDKFAIDRALELEGKGQPTAGLLVEDDAAGEQPPTYIKRTEFSFYFQELIETYGCPGYKEANPGLFACVTFPFLFGIMYGDVFHGGCLLLFGIYLCLFSDSLKLSGETGRMLAGVRYLLLMMGFFAVYAGLMYNDFLSLGVNLFPTRYSISSMDEKGNFEMSSNFDVFADETSGPYPFGLDPAWAGADNELLFVNSMKMKLSVLVGVAQMFLGVCLRFSNAIYFQSKTDFFCECMPMLIFLCCFFGYMDWMIIYKWVSPPTTNPSLINSMISMGLGQPDKDPLYDSQVYVQGWLMTLTAISVPWLLLPKPIILAAQDAMKPKKVHADEEQVAAPAGGGHGHGHGEFDLAEIVIHQVIETIEFVLGTVSHTASYLRLWALSLAHQQLSLVFFQKSMNSALESGNPIMIYVGFAVLMAITAGVLLGMDVLECFLHTLRLHWVEFQSKFFKADGYFFTPFSHEVSLASE